MMDCNKNCKYFSNITNTDKVKKGICTFPEEYVPVDIGAPCPFTPRDWTPTCADCDRLGNDYACYTCKPEDSALHNGEICCGFVDIAETDFMKALYRLKMQKRYSRETINQWISKFEDEFRTPQDKK